MTVHRLIYDVILFEQSICAVNYQKNFKFL